MSRLSILYDGWALAHRPNHPAAIHLLTLLHYHPPDFAASIALPGETMHVLPESITIHSLPTPNQPSQHLAWEQRLLPKLAIQTNAACIHMTSPYPALFGKVPILISPCEYWAERSLNTLPTESGFIEHLRTALGQGGLSRARAILWPEDIPDAGMPAPKITLPPIVHPAYLAKDLTSPVHQRELLHALDLPEGYVLYHGPGDRESLEDLLAAWSWAAAPIGENTPLVILGLNPDEQNLCAQLLQEHEFGSTLRILPALNLEDLAAVYRSCSAVLHPGRYAAWGGAIRAALACEKPVVACETPGLSALVGKAAYLIQAGQPGSSRALGAALITVVVEESVGEHLAHSARQLTQNWNAAAFAEALSRIYRTLQTGG